MVAAALKGAGLWLGDQLDGASFEDTEIASVIEQKTPAMDRLLQAARCPAMWQLALGGVDVGDLASLISRRNDAHRQWGFKRPNILTRLRQDGLTLFRQPRVVLCFRDPVAIAQRSAIAEGVEIGEALRNARRMVEANLKSASALTVPVMMVSFEKVAHNRVGFLDELFRFCSLPVGRASYPAIQAFMDRAGREYKRLTAAPLAGYIERPSRTLLSGWCHLPKMRDPAAVDLYADGRRLMTVVADRFRPDLKIASFRSPNRGFEIDLTSFHLMGRETIDVTVAGTGTKLEGSGFRLDQPLPLHSSSSAPKHDGIGRYAASRRKS